jgi:CDP-diacylglycerol---glycerol-3-phosphate 3-phosphatidyltransferase
MKFKLNIPNKISIIRITLIPLFVLVLLINHPYKNYLAAFIFTMLSISDFFDGYLARKKKQITDFGKVIDPIADKLLIGTALIVLAARNSIDLWMAAVIIAREIIVTAIRIYLLPSKIVVPASGFGKAKTVVQSLAIVAVLLEIPLSWHFMVVAVIITIISGVEYLVRIRKITQNQIVNLPNLITLTRLLLIIPFIYYFLNSKINYSIIIFALIALGDKLDGVSARMMRQMTRLGSAFDSFTDWIFITSTLAAFVYGGKIKPLIGFIFTISLILIAVMKFYYIKQYKEISAMAMGKISVGIAYATILTFLIDFNYKSVFLTATLIAGVATIIMFLVKTKKFSL